MIKNKILLVEDDTDIILWISSYFEEFGFDLKSTETVTDAISHIKQFHYDLVILDLNLPDFLGYEVLKYIQDNKLSLPIIVISAYSDMKTKLRAFKLGAKDYMVKPLNLEELEARIEIHIRDTINFEPKQEIFTLQNNQIYFQNQALKLTKIEYEILKTLLKHKNSILERELLSRSLSSISSTRSLDYHIKNLRKKIGDNPSNPSYIVTVYGVGYKLNI